MGASTQTALSERIELVEAECVRIALQHHRAGLAFADALHLMQAEDTTFLTMDRKLLRRSAKLGLNVETVSR
ncbi:MAG TPA: hypothetical protein PKE27_10755 [Povalibacter sp.]|uniref:hypothetical protein n=1 Tax=Povalibacter sp. TaxID=1962978 RepID=UPI002C5AD77D|nr:hypothetical protein [Povalibacter sp.]HMN45046.1 hypothetical protein [Povalibacter sp.]